MGRKEEIAQEVNAIREAGGKIPHLAAIIVGHDGASETYVGHKEKACTQVVRKRVLYIFGSLREGPIQNFSSRSQYRSEF